MKIQNTIMLTVSLILNTGYSLGAESNKAKLFDDMANNNAIQTIGDSTHLNFNPLYHKTVGNKKNWDNIQRDLTAINILPTVWFNNGTLTFEGVRTIDNLEYQILDAEGTSVLEGTLTIDAHKTQTIELPNLPAGTYLLVLTIGNESFAAEFEI